LINVTANVKQKNHTSSLYWKCQLIGWSVASLYWLLMGMIGTEFSLPLAILLFVGDLAIYILPTHLFRIISLKNKWEQWQPRKLLRVVLPSIILVGLAFMVLTICKNFLSKFYFYPQFNETFSNYFRDAWLVTWMTGIRLAAIWILAYYLYHYAQAEMKATKESSRLALVAKSAQLENLTAQLNPHFFFNSLNNIKALVSENPTNARRAIDLLSELLRTSLYRTNTPLHTLQQEIDLLKDYLELEKMRFEERLQVIMNIPESLLTILVLPLSIQTLVENAIKHGISNEVKGGAIAINVEQKNPFIVIKVQNTGRLTEKGNGGLGLKNLKERLDLQYHGEAIFTVAEVEQDQVLATLILPIS
jgi:sensor histidine kinase YesM